MHEEKYKIRTQRSFYDRKQFHQNPDGGGQYQQQQHYFKKKQFSVKKAEKYAKYRAKVAAKYGQVNQARQNEQAEKDYHRQGSDD